MTTRQTVGKCPNCGKQIIVTLFHWDMARYDYEDDPPQIKTEQVDGSYFECDHCGASNYDANF